jgi:GT2 family glycosyltransferase
VSGASSRVGDAATPLSIVVPLGAAGGAASGPLLASLKAQSDQAWEAIVVNASGVELRDVAASNVRVLEASPTATLAEVLTMGVAASSGDVIAFAHPLTTWDSKAVELFKAELNCGADVAYGDEVRGGALFAKPAHSPERLRSQFYWGGATAYRREAFDRIGGIREGFPGAELYDLALRASRSGVAVSHIGHVVTTSPGDQPPLMWDLGDNVVAGSTASALTEHLSQTGGGDVVAINAHGVHDTRRRVQGSPLVSIIIPTRGDSATVHGRERCMVVEAVRSVVERSSYRNVEFVIVIDTEAPAHVRDALGEIAGALVRFVEWDAPFTFSGKMNLGVLWARGEFSLLLNDDVEVISSDWIESMLSLAQLPHAGMVGSMLYFEDDSIQHAGHAYQRVDVTHIGLHSQRGAAGPWGAFTMDREVGGVTAACAMVRTAAFIEVGGFSPLLPGNFNDVDLCMKLTTVGYRNYWTPRAELYHFESKTRDPRVTRSEIDTLWNRWEHLIWPSPWWPTDAHEVYGADVGVS